VPPHPAQSTGRAAAARNRRAPGSPRPKSTAARPGTAGAPSESDASPKAPRPGADAETLIGYYRQTLLPDPALYRFPRWADGKVPACSGRRSMAGGHGEEVA
ncbi:hypothetical protein ACN3XK_73000, partial [Actinomadura welshii]